MKCAIKGKRGVYKWLVSISNNSTVDRSPRWNEGLSSGSVLFVRSWPPVHERGVYELVGLYLLRQILIFNLVRLKCTRRLGLCYDSGRRFYGHTKRA